MENLFFSHAEQKLLPLSTPTKENIMEWMEEQIQHLCQDNVLLVNGRWYCHRNLVEFMYDMNKTYDIDLHTLFNQYQNELWGVVLQDYLNLSEVLKSFKQQ